MNAQAHPLPESDERQLKNMASRYVTDYPDLNALARSAAQSIIFRHTGKHLDPDQVYWHRFSSASSSSRSFTGWQHAGATVKSMTMTELVIRRFNVSEQRAPDELAVYGGFYTDGPEHGFYDERNEVRMLPAEVLNDFWALDFSAGYRRQMDRFWAQHSDNFCVLAKVRYLASAGESLSRNQLSATDFDMLRSVLATGPGPATLAQLREPMPATSAVSVFHLELGAFKARDILRIVDENGRQILYVCGAQTPFYCFDTHHQLYEWLKAQFLSIRTREAFCARFLHSASDWETHRAAFQRDVAQLLSNDHDDAGANRLVNRGAEPIPGDPFVYLRDVARHDMTSDATTLLTDNSDLRKQIWLGYLNAFLSVFGNLAPLGWPLALAVVGASLISTGLNIDQAVNGKSAEQRRRGIVGAIASAIYLCLNLPLLSRMGADVREPMKAPSPMGPNAGANAIPTLLATDPLSGMSDNAVLESLTPVSEEGPYQGAYRLSNGETWAIIEGQAHRLNFDESLGSWVMVDPHNPFAFNGRCPVRFDGQGQWERLPIPGLSGGAPMDAGAVTISPPPATPVANVQSAFWDRFMQLNLFDEQLYSEAALARQQAAVEVFCMEPHEIITTDSEGEDVHFDQWGARHRVFKTADGEFVGSSITHYTHEDDAYNQFLRTGVAIYSDQVALVQRLAEDVTTLGYNNDVALYRGGSGARGTSGAFFRTGDVTVGDVLVNTDITSFSENPYQARTFASSQAGVHASATDAPIRFDDTSVVFVLPEKNYLSAAPIAPFSASPEEAEAIFLPGHYFQIDSIEQVVGTFYRFMKVQLREVTGPVPGRKLLDMRTAEPFIRQNYAARLGGAGRVLVDRFFPIQQP
ncbi:DUF6543 domain-containing protein [Pseudomonas sp. W2-17]|uniref:dermonecrotic toxin domain-containing protein n=1 Tax=Pseudomonas sp. W2-17 TaxID=3058039 RepID=UPI0034E0C7B6